MQALLIIELGSALGYQSASLNEEKTENEHAHDR
jgi:hypothetical protein